MSRLTIRPATLEDFLRFYGRTPIATVRALVALLDGVPVGIGGYFMRNGTAVAFTDMHPELAGRKRDIIRCARELMAFIRASRLPMLAACKPGGKGTAMEHYGFMRWGGDDSSWFALVN